jgi:hypothetical protein
LNLGNHKINNLTMPDLIFFHRSIFTRVRVMNHNSEYHLIEKYKVLENFECWRNYPELFFHQFFSKAFPIKILFVCRNLIGFAVSILLNNSISIEISQNGLENFLLHCHLNSSHIRLHIVHLFLNWDIISITFIM